VEFGLDLSYRQFSQEQSNDEDGNEFSLRALGAALFVRVTL
jgi:hypothetical protein